MDARGRVLIAQRPPGKHLAGLWEFPGGKVEPGEGRVDALRRELKEELGISIGAPRPLLRLRHTYPYGTVLLDVWVVRRYVGEPRSLDGQALRWCARGALGAADLLPADGPIVRALWLPERLEVRETARYRVVGFTEFSGGERGGGGPPRLVGVICGNVEEARRAAGAGADFVVLGVSLGEAGLREVCGQVEVPVFARGVSSARAWRAGARGVNRIE